MFNEVNEPLYSRSQLETKAHDLDLNRFLRKTGMPGIGFSLGCRSREYPSSQQIFPDDVAISALLSLIKNHIEKNLNKENFSK